MISEYSNASLKAVAFPESFFSPSLRYLVSSAFGKKTKGKQQQQPRFFSAKKPERVSNCANNVHGGRKDGEERGRGLGRGCLRDAAVPTQATYVASYTFLT